MSRLTKSSGKFVSCNIDDECTGMCSSCKRNTEIRHKLRYYEDLEEQLEKLYGGKMPLDEVVENLNRIVQNGEEKLDYARILTNAEAEKWDKWLSLEEQGRLVELPCAVGDAVYLFLHDIIHPFTIDGFTLTKYGVEFKASYCGEEKNLEHWAIRLPVSKICKTVFLTKEEAEEKLKEER